MARRDSGKKAAKGGRSRPAKRPKNLSKSLSKASSKTSPDTSSGGEWPLKRQTLFKPERMKYVRKQIEVKGCVFCEALARGVKRESLVLFADDTVMVVMNKYPYNTGHLLVLPRRHEGDITALSEEENARVFAMVQTCIGILKEAYNPAAFNVGLNLGVGAGAGIPEHLHTHIIPRWNGDTNFFPLIAQTKVVIETLEQTYDRLVPYFDARK
jgi:ATP adenylyltransferase